MAEAEGAKPSSAAAPAAPGAVAPPRLQPEPSPQQPPDIRADLTCAEQDEAAHVDRLAADAELVDLLREKGFAGVEYNYAAQELVRYGVAVLTRWLFTQEIYAVMINRLGVGLDRPRTPIDLNEARSLAGEIVTVSLKRFRDDVLIPNKWTPTKGASLTTYFVGQCLLRLPNIYRGWLKTYEDQFNTNLSPQDRFRYAVRETTGITSRDIEHDVITDLVGAAGLRHVRSLDARKALVYTALGYTQGDIATELGTTEKAVERMIAYARSQVKKTTKKEDSA